MQSDWVEDEVKEARKLEKELGHNVLYPVVLDDGWKSGRWSKHIMEQITEQYILDFSGWRNNSRFEDMFQKMIGRLELFKKG
jgi:hypothetical protein